MGMLVIIAGSIFCFLLEMWLIFYAFSTHGFIAGVLTFFIGGPVIYQLGMWVFVPLATAVHIFTGGDQ